MVLKEKKGFYVLYVSLKVNWEIKWVNSKVFCYMMKWIILFGFYCDECFIILIVRFL